MAKLGVSFWPTGLRYTEVRDLGKLVEENGYDGVFIVEGGHTNDAMATAQAIASVTSRITVGTGIANLYFRHPATLGAGAVAIDELSGGRFILGIGASNPEIVKSMGLTWRESRAALTETTHWLRQVFAGEKRPELFSPFVAAKHNIPIHWAALGLGSSECAGEYTDGLMLYLATKEWVQQTTARMQQGAQKAGRNADEIEVSLLIPTFLSEDLDAAREAARNFLSFYSSIYVYKQMFKKSGFKTEIIGVIQALERGDQKTAAACILDQLMDAVCLVGPVSRSKERLAAFREDGVSYPIIAHQAVQEEPATAARKLIQAFGR